MTKRNAWSPRRFKKFPRFTIFLNKNGNEEDDPEAQGAKDYLRENIISLNPDFMNLLLNANASAGGTEQAVQQIESALASINFPQNLQHPSQARGRSQDKNEHDIATALLEDENPGYRFQDPFDKVVRPRQVDPAESARNLSDALRDGAFTVLDDPVPVETMLQALERVVRRHYRDHWPAA
jgi:hypothetical protein